MLLLQVLDLLQVFGLRQELGLKLSELTTLSYVIE